MVRLRHVLALEPGMSVADVGAGKGELTVALAAEVGPSGRVYSTEIDPESLEQIRAAAAAARLANVTIVQARARETGLPASCCEAIVLRRVYHHLTDPAATNASLLHALRPGGLLVVIDFPPLLSWMWPWPPTGVPRNRGGHGVDARLVAQEVVASGFELVQIIEDWPGRWPLASYCAVFTKPRRPAPGPADGTPRGAAGAELAPDGRGEGPSAESGNGVAGEKKRPITRRRPLARGFQPAVHETTRPRGRNSVTV